MRGHSHGPCHTAFLLTLPAVYSRRLRVTPFDGGAQVAQSGQIAIAATAPLSMPHGNL